MRTAIIIASGLVLWALLIGVARLLPNPSPQSTTIATVTFVVLWFIAAALNMWIGVSRAGYSFMEELPVFLVIFLVPAAVAVLVKWKVL